MARRQRHDNVGHCQLARDTAAMAFGAREPIAAQLGFDHVGTR
ncbi:hypothetical protein [Actinopolymorpha pittospori]